MDNAACTALRGTFSCRIMKQQGHVVDEVVCFILLRLCFNSLRATWLPGGYPPKKDASKVRKLHSHFSHLHFAGTLPEWFSCY